MQIDYAKGAGRGVTALMYVGDTGDGLGGDNTIRNTNIGALVFLGIVGVMLAVSHAAERRDRHRRRRKNR